MYTFPTTLAQLRPLREGLKQTHVIYMYFVDVPGHVHVHMNVTNVPSGAISIELFPSTTYLMWYVHLALRKNALNNAMMRASASFHVNLGFANAQSPTIHIHWCPPN